jgi:hypothetical protein
VPNRVSVYGYVTQFAGVPAATAILTFQADISVQPVAGNGALGPNRYAVLPSQVTPGKFRLYYNQSPNRQWTDPKTFATNTTSAALDSSSRFTPGGVEVHLRQLLRNGVTNISTVNVTLIPGRTQVLAGFAFAGYALAIGN